MNPSLKNGLLAVLGSPVIKPLFWLACQATGQTRLWQSFAKNHAERLFIATLPTPPHVLAGPFEGLKYTVIHAVGSVLAPKLLGTYEQELFSIWQGWQSRGYTAILDIGCAEGFYAVGMARLWPAATVYAYDIDQTALQLCRTLASANNVGERVLVQGACSADVLLHFPFNGRGLILSDCEGFERELFTETTMPALASADIVIEVHDEAGPGFMEKVEQLASSTHTSTRIVTQPRPAGTSPLLAKYAPNQQELILSEWRGSTLDGKPQYWLVLQSRA
jgi:hypothetical protein